MNVTLYSLYKKTNSTLQPSADTPKIVLDVNLKEDTSLYYPSSLVGMPPEATDVPYNY